MPIVKGKGATADADSIVTTRRTVPRTGVEPSFGRVTPENRKMAFARHQNFDILVAENAVVATAAAALITAWEAWQADSDHEHHRILDASFEHYTIATVHGFLLYVTYSK